MSVQSSSQSLNEKVAQLSRDVQTLLQRIVDLEDELENVEDDGGSVRKEFEKLKAQLTEEINQRLAAAESRASQRQR